MLRVEYVAASKLIRMLISFMCSQILIAMISSHILEILLPYFVGLLLHLVV